MDGVRWSMTNHGLTEEDISHTVLVWESRAIAEMVSRQPLTVEARVSPHGICDG
jgi:hypothetical protein